MLRLGTAYDKAPVQDQFRTPRLPDDDRIWAAGGFQWKLSREGDRRRRLRAHLRERRRAAATCPNQDTPTSTPVGRARRHLQREGRHPRRADQPALLDATQRVSASRRRASRSRGRAPFLVPASRLFDAARALVETPPCPLPAPKRPPCPARASCAGSAPPASPPSVVNSTVGAGIFVLPAAVALRIGAAAPLAFLLCLATISLVVACFALAGSRVSAQRRRLRLRRARVRPLRRVSSPASCSGSPTSSPARGSPPRWPPRWASSSRRSAPAPGARRSSSSLLGGLALVNVRGVRSGVTLVKGAHRPEAAAARRSSSPPGCSPWLPRTSRGRGCRRAARSATPSCC